METVRLCPGWSGINWGKLARKFRTGLIVRAWESGWGVGGDHHHEGDDHEGDDDERWIFADGDDEEAADDDGNVLIVDCDMEVIQR